jgi:peptidyl-prolyl cis-trans isomerase SurA
MIDEELEHRAAAAAKISVSAQEVEEALGRVAQQNKVSVEDLMSEAQKTGLDPRGYREEIRRQLLEAKLMNLKVQGRIRVSDEDVKASYRRLVVEERRSLSFRAAWVQIGTAPGAKATDVEAKHQLARTIAQQAKAGEDFSRLARSYSDDAKTRDKGGLLERMRPGSLPLEVDKALLSLDVGEVTSPLRYGGDFYVVKLMERDPSQLPPFSEAEVELQNRVYMEKMERAKRHWLDGLRKQAHVDMRL